MFRTCLGVAPVYNFGEDFSLYEERLEQFFLANYVEDDRRVAVLLTVIGEKVYKVLRDLCDPQKPKEKTYDQLCMLLRDQFSKKISVFKERNEFYDLYQEENEKVRE